MHPNKFRIVIDSVLAVAIITLAFWSGVQSQKINDLEVDVSDRGRVQISIEADHRLTVLEQEVKDLQAEHKH